MKTAKLSDMTKGWFIGNFEPSLLKTNDCEVAVKEYKAGAYEKKHYHKIATEFTVVLDGKVRMFDQEYQAGDIIVAEPGDATDFTALTDARNVVVKIPGANDDKYVCVEPDNVITHSLGDYGVRPEGVQSDNNRNNLEEKDRC